MRKRKKGLRGYISFKGILPVTWRPDMWTPVLSPAISLTLVFSIWQCKNCQRNSGMQTPGLPCSGQGIEDFIFNQHPAHPRILHQGTKSALSYTALSWAALTAVLGLVCILSLYVRVFWGLEHKHIQKCRCIHVLRKVHSLPTETSASENQHLTIQMERNRVSYGQIYAVPPCAHFCLPTPALHGHTKSPLTVMITLSETAVRSSSTVGNYISHCPVNILDPVLCGN